MILSNFSYSPIFSPMRHDKWGRSYPFRVYVVGFLLALFSVATNAAQDAAQEHKHELRPAASLWYQELAAQGDVDAKYNLG
ncbi:MAG: hypothetical protein V3R49_07115, partial [Gammaproteobacteria bacterium]